MSLEDAIKVIEKEYPDMVILEYWDFPDFFGFVLTEKGREDEPFGGGWDTVNKTDGTIGVFNPIDDFDLFRKAKKIQID